WHDYPAGIAGRTEADLLAWFDAHVKPSETWLDVGAHYGYTAIALAKCVGETGRVVAFEPVVASAGCIDQTRMLNGLPPLMVVPMGLGDPEGVTWSELPLERGMADSTLRDATNRWQQSLLIARFDWLWPRLSSTPGRVHGIKIDVQGMELATLRGMTDLLARD